MNRLIVLAVALVACGGVAKKNVQACEDFVAALGECEGVDTSIYEGEGYCDAWGEYECDVSQYFSDVTDYLNCGGEFDPTAEAPVIPVCE